MDENVIRKRNDKFNKSVNHDLVDERMSASLSKRKLKSDENIMKNRSKIYYRSCLEVNEILLDKITPEIREKIISLNDVFKHFILVSKIRIL